jgi:hypothetical protein
MLELSPNLQQALDANGTEPLRVVDPRTQQAYVLLRAEEYERLQSVPAPEPVPEVPPGIRRSQEAFLRDLPVLMANPKNRGRWVAYHGDERIGIARDPDVLIREILRRGIPDDAYDLAVIRPHEPEPEEVEPIHPHHFWEEDEATET